MLNNICLLKFVLISQTETSIRIFSRGSNFAIISLLYLVFTVTDYILYRTDFGLHLY